MQNYSELRCLGTARLHPIHSSLCRKHSGARSTQPGGKHYVSKPKKLVKLPHLLKKQRLYMWNGQNHIWKLSTFFLLSAVLMGIPQVSLPPSLNNKLAHDVSSSYSKVYIW